MSTKTITITDLADVQPGDIVTADYIPMFNERGARIVGEASQAATGELIVGGHFLRFADGGDNTPLLFVSATREVPAWEPPAELVAAFADNLARLWGSTDAGAVYKEDARQLLGWMHDNGWLADADPAPVDPVLDETDKRDRIDDEGDRWRWWGNAETWQFADDYIRGTLASINRQYGPLSFADEETDE